MQHNKPSRHTDEQEQRGEVHRTHKTTHGAGKPVNRSQVAKDTAHTAHGACIQVNKSQVTQDTAHAAQPTERAHQ